MAAVIMSVFIVSSSKADQARAIIIQFGRPPAVYLDHVCTSDKSSAGAGHSLDPRNTPMF
jgi:hypothetical protein